MSLLDVLRNGVAIANSVTKDIQAEVTFIRLAGVDGEGTPLPANAPVRLKAIVDWKQKHLRTTSGELSVSRASVMFLDIVALMAATGGLGIDDTDQIILPDGTTGPIIDMSGVIDAGTGQPIATEVFIG